MTGTRNLKKVNILFPFSISFLFGGNIVAAESQRDRIVLGAVNQPLSGVRNGKLHRVRFPVMVPDFAGRASEKLNHRVVAEMQRVGPLQVNYPGPRDDAADGGLMRGKAQCELTARGMSEHDAAGCVQLVLLRVLQKKVVGRTDVGKSAGPCSTVIANAAILKVGGGETFRGQSCAKVPGMIEAVFSAPEAPMNVYDDGMH